MSNVFERLESYQVPVDAEPIIAPLRKTTWRWWLWTLFLTSVVAWGMTMWIRQLMMGLGNTGLGRPMYWGFYVINFVFFVGISHAGTLISAILRVSGAEWRKPVTRIAEFVTVFALMVGPINIIFDLGRPDRIINLFIHGNLTSPLLWDVISVCCYLIGSLVYLYVPMIPDMAYIARKNVKWQPFYRFMSLGYNGSPRQERLITILISVLAIAIIPIAVSVHTIISWIFGMTVQPMWHSTIFGPYFVVGAIFSGIATLLLVMYVLRATLHLEDYIKPVHFNNLALLELVMVCLWVYFTFSEYLTTFYGAEPSHMAVFWAKMSGEYAVPFWIMIVCCVGIPFPVLAINKLRHKLPLVMIAAFTINIGMWLERYLIISPTLSRPRLAYGIGLYTPTWTEIAILAMDTAGFMLLYTLAVKVFPMITIWEIQEDEIGEFKEELKKEWQASGELLPATSASEAVDSA